MANENYMTPLILILDQLRKNGYTDDFILTNEGLFSKNTNETYRPEDLSIEKVYRFEGYSNPDDMAIMFGIKSYNGVRGVVIDAYGAYENDELGKFLKNVKLEEHKI